MLLTISLFLSLSQNKFLTAPSSEGAKGGDTATEARSISEGAKGRLMVTAAYRLLSVCRYHSLTSKI